MGGTRGKRKQFRMTPKDATHSNISFKAVCREVRSAGVVFDAARQERYWPGKVEGLSWLWSVELTGAASAERHLLVANIVAWSVLHVLAVVGPPLAEVALS